MNNDYNMMICGITKIVASKSNLKYFKNMFVSKRNGFFLVVFELNWGLHVLAPKRHRPFPPVAAAEAMFSVDSSLMIPIFLPKFRTPSITFCCIKLKHIAITAIPMRIYNEQSMNWGFTPPPNPNTPSSPDTSSVIFSPGTISPNPMVLKVMKQK